MVGIDLIQWNIHFIYNYNICVCLIRSFIFTFSAHLSFIAWGQFVNILDYIVCIRRRAAWHVSIVAYSAFEMIGWGGEVGGETVSTLRFSSICDGCVAVGIAWYAAAVERRCLNKIEMC